MRLASLLALAVMTGGTSSAQLCRQDLAPDGPLVDPNGFGRALDASGELVIVGAPSTSASGPFGAPVYRRDPTTSRLVLEAVLTPADPQLASGFGTDVHIAGDLAVVGAWTASTSSVTQCGAAYVFRRVGASWVQEAKLVATDATAGDAFGFRVRISGDEVVASAPYRRLGPTDRAGAVYMFRRVSGTWTEVEVLEPPTSANSTYFGVRLEFDGTTVAVMGDADPGRENVTLFRRSPLFGVFVRESDVFGYRGGMALLGDRVVTAHVLDSGSGPLVSTIRTYTRDPALATWTESAPELLGQGEGASLVSDGTHLVIALGVGSPGTALVYQWSGAAWTFVRPLVAPAHRVWTYSPLGSALALSGDHVIASGNEGPLLGQRRVYDFDVTCETVGAVYCQQSVANSSGAAGDLVLVGSDVTSANDLTALASQLPAQAFGFFLTSRTADAVPGAGGSLGTLCLGGAIGRYVGPQQIQSSGAIGAFSLPIDLSGLPTPTGAVVAAAGETWRFQAWYRDAAPGPVSNFTDAVELLLQ